MGGDIETIKERLDIAEVVGGYVKLEKAGVSYKGRCPFHNEKTPSFFVSPLRQSYYCFGCGAKGDIFTFIQEMDGLNFREALKELASRAGVELKGRAESQQAKTEKDRIREALVAATQFFENKLADHAAARSYLASRGVREESIKLWKLGYAPAEWRSLYSYLLSAGFSREILIKAGLARPVADAVGKEPYDVFRDRLIFPISDANGDIIAFSGRALAPETEPKYLNTPETMLFAKNKILYGLDKAKMEIRKRDFTILVEGQMDLVLSHQAGVPNTVASSGTAFTQAHLERLKGLSSRIILAFDGDEAGKKATEKSAALAVWLGLDVKIAILPPGKDPADLVRESPDKWKNVLREAQPALEIFLEEVVKEKNPTKMGKLIERKLVPFIALFPSRIDKESAVSRVAQRTGRSPQNIGESVKNVKVEEAKRLLIDEDNDLESESEVRVLSHQEKIEERLTEVRTWLAELPENSAEAKDLLKEEMELTTSLSQEALREELSGLSVALAQAETSKDNEKVRELIERIGSLHKELRILEEKKKDVL